MDGWDMKKWEVYKKGGVCRKRGSGHKYQETKIKTSTLRERREWTVTIPV